jgi:acetyl-CoA carboxylase biotin carboxylase subunit
MGRFKKVLIANRGEIAVRIARTLREMRVASVAVYSEADRASLHVTSADEAVPIGPAPARQSYLDVERLIEAARQSGADALHPGYGFLSESPDLADACARAGVVFIGPPASAMRRMGLKIEAREAMQAAGVPIIPGGPARDLAEAKQTAAQIGYPVLLKPSAGGGGKGMRRVFGEQELPEAFARARSEAQNAFGNGTVYLEKLLDRARHVEVQLLGDQHGNVLHLYERDCSLQRRHQKIVEETPCLALPEDRALEIGEVAVRGARAIGYFSAGTMEFLLAPSGELYFLEMNTRLQVEHPVTESCTGVDLVEQMVRVAQGEPLAWTKPPERRGHALECRIYAEDPAQNFLPSPGRIDRLELPAGPGVRNDEGARSGQVIPPDYDPLIAKLIVHGADRAQALRRALRALSEYRVTGIATNLEFLRRVISHEAFANDRHDTRFLDENVGEVLAGQPSLDAGDLAAIAALSHRRAQRRELGGAARDAALSPWVLEHRAFNRRGRG